MDTVVLYLILFTPPSADPLLVAAIDQCPTLRRAVEGAASTYELIDPRSFYGAELVLTNIRTNDLGDAPYTWTYSHVLPSYGATRDNWLFAFDYCDRLRKLTELDPANADSYADVIAEAEFLLRVWSRLNDATNPHINLTSRRDALRDVERMLGREACQVGDWPPPVPVWRFRRIGG